MGNEKRSYLMKALHGLQEHTRLPPPASPADEAEADHHTAATMATATEEAMPSLLSLPADQEKRIVLPEDDDNENEQQPPYAMDDFDLDEEALDDEAADLEDAFAFVRKEVRRKPCNHNHKYALESLAALAKVPLAGQALKYKETMLGRMPGFPIDQLEHDVDRFLKFYANLVSSQPEGGGRKARVLPTEMDKRVMLYEALVRALKGGIVDVEEARLLLTLGAKCFVVALYALMNEFEYRMYTDIFKTSPGVGVDASDVFHQYLSTAFQKGCALLKLQPGEVELIENDCISKNELNYLTSAKR